MSTSTETKTDVNHQNQEKMDAIKQLIFGDNMVEYDQRFKEVFDRIEKTQAELEDKLNSLDGQVKSTIEQLNKEFQLKSENLENQFLKAIEKLEDKKTDRKNLGKMLQNIGEKLQA
tara:strand:+ start:393 stop:740 length:348 start_codon:yes stop_codon:yes gene_type:complete